MSEDRKPRPPVRQYVKCWCCGLLIGVTVLAPRNYDGLCPRCGSEVEEG